PEILPVVSAGEYRCRLSGREPLTVWRPPGPIDRASYDMEGVAVPRVTTSTERRSIVIIKDELPPLNVSADGVVREGTVSEEGAPNHSQCDHVTVTTDIITSDLYVAVATARYLKSKTVSVT